MVQGISRLPLDKGNKLKGSWRLTKEGGVCGYVKGKKEKEEQWEKDWLLVLMCARIKHGGKVCKNKA